MTSRRTRRSVEKNDPKILWSVNEANPDLICDQSADENVESQLASGYVAWKSPEKARAYVERLVRELYEEDEATFGLPPTQFKWKTERMIDGSKQYRLNLVRDIGVVYLVHPVEVLNE